MYTIETKYLKHVHQALDGFILSISFISAYFIKRYLLPVEFRGISQVPNYYFVLLLVLVICFITFNMFGFYDSYRGKVVDQIIGNTLKGVLISFGVVIFTLYLLKASDISRILFGIFILSSFILLSISKGIIFYSFLFHNEREISKRNILVIGSKKRAFELIKRIVDQVDSSFKVIGCLDIDDERVGIEVYEGVKVLSSILEYKKILRDQPIDEVIFSMPLREIDNVKSYIYYAENMGTNIRIMPDWEIPRIRYKMENATAYFHKFMGFQTVVFSSVPQNGSALFVKSIMDYTISFVSLVLLSPLFLFIGLMIKCTSKGPMFYKQKRSGLGGRKFDVLKFRTMVENAEELQKDLIEKNEVDGPVFKIEKDPRVTLIGKFLRKTSLDELPQLINILRGEMSLVGPRPPIPTEVERYEICHRRRLSMKPGLTCIWQVNGRNSVKFETWMKMDLEYIDTWSLWLDVKLLLLTVPAILFGTGQ